MSRDLAGAASAASWLLMLVGVLSVAAGLIVLAKPSHSLATLAVIFGVFVVIDSIYELATSLFAERGAVGALLGVLGIVVGILLIRHPIHGVLAVGLLIGIWFVAAGVIRLVRAFALEARPWHVLVGLLELVAGVVIVSSPHVGFATLALLLGISLILNGLAIVGLGWTVHALRRATRSPVPDAGVHA